MVTGVRAGDTIVTPEHGVVVVDRVIDSPIKGRPDAVAFEYLVDGVRFDVQDEKIGSPSGDAVNHPSHYGGDVPYETIKVLKAWLTPEQFYGFCVGNTIKYLSRAGKKGDLVEDLKKANFYAEYIINTEEERA